jgi:arginase family enzyme
VPETKNLSSRQRRNFHPSPEVDLILAPWGFGGTDNLAQEGAHSFIENDMVAKLEAVGCKVSSCEPPALGPFQIQEDPEHIRNLEAIIQVNTWLSQRIEQSIVSNHLPVLLGGDASLSIASVAALSRQIPKLGIIWLSNHLNNSSPDVTKSWNANRMSFTTISFAGDLSKQHPDFQTLLKAHGDKNPLVPSENIVHIGVSHKSAEETCDHLYFTMEDIDELSMRRAISMAISRLKNCDKIHVIWDMNVLDLSGVSNHSPGQLSYREAVMIARELDMQVRRQNRLAAIDIVEHCPSREAWDKRGEAASWVTDIVANIFGETIFNALRKY